MKKITKTPPQRNLRRALAASVLAASLLGVTPVPAVAQSNVHYISMDELAATNSDFTAGVEAFEAVIANELQPTSKRYKRDIKLNDLTPAAIDFLFLDLVHNDKAFAQIEKLLLPYLDKGINVLKTGLSILLDDLKRPEGLVVTTSKNEVNTQDAPTTANKVIRSVTIKNDYKVPVDIKAFEEGLIKFGELRWDTKGITDVETKVRLMANLKVWKKIVPVLVEKLEEHGLYGNRAVAPLGYKCELTDKGANYNEEIAKSYNQTKDNQLPYLPKGATATCTLEEPITEDDLTLKKVRELKNQQFGIEWFLTPTSDKYNMIDGIVPRYADPVTFSEIKLDTALADPKLAETTKAPAKQVAPGTKFTRSFTVENKDSREVGVRANKDYTCTPNPISVGGSATCTKEVAISAEDIANKAVAEEDVTVTITHTQDPNAEKTATASITLAKQVVGPIPPAPTTGGTPIQPPKQEETKPEETKPEETKPEETKPAATATRVKGENRILTAQAIAEIVKPKAAVFANAYSQVDAASATAFANVRDAAMLLTDGKAVEKENLEFLKAKKITKVFIAGGKAAISEAFESTLKAEGFEVERISGSNRFATSEAFANATIKADPSYDSVFITDGAVQNALTTAAGASIRNSVTVMIDGVGIPESLGTFKNTIILGDRAIAYSEKGAKPSGNVIKIAGEKVFEINVNFNKAVFPDATQAYIASEETIADALAIGPLAALQEAPLFLVSKNEVPAVTNDYLKASKIATYTIIGGSQAVSAEVEAALTSATKE